MSRFFRRRERSEAELDEEIRSHFRLAVEERVARGEAPSDAERAVRREFGSVLDVKEVTREVWGGIWFERLVQDVRFAFRSLRRAPAFAIAAVLTLALGIGANTAVFTVVNGVLLRPLPFPEPERLVLVSHGPPPGRFAITPGLTEADYLALDENHPGLERITTFSNQPMALTRVGDPLRLNVATVTPGFFEVLGVPPMAGRGFLPGEDLAGRDDVAVLGHDLWQSRFAGDSAVIGAEVTLDGVRRKVVGVMPAAFDFPNGAEAWIPLAVRIDPGNSLFRQVVARLRPDMTLEQARAAFSTLMANRIRDGQDETAVSRVVPLQAHMVGDIRQSLIIFSGAVAFVLLIACANVANLLLMRATARQRELMLRTALGAGRARLVRQLLTESVIVSLLGGTAGTLLAFVGVDALISLAPGSRIPRIESIRIDGVVLGVTMLVSVLTGIAFGLVPSLRATRGDLRRALNVGGRSPVSDGGHASGVLTLTQVALALVLLTGAGLMMRSFRNMRAVELGFTPSNVLTMTVDLPESSYPGGAEMQDVHGRILAGLSALPSVEAAGAVNWRPLGQMILSGDFSVEGGPALASGYWADKLAVSPDYFEAMGIRLLDGRSFTSSDGPNTTGVVMVSRSLADRFWPDSNAVGKRLAIVGDPSPEDWLTVVGVVDDVVQREITGDKAAAIYQPYAQVQAPFLLSRVTYVTRSAARPQTLADGMREVVRSADPNLPVHTVASMDELVASTTREPLFLTWLLASFSALALLLSATGVYGVLAYGVARRRFEIGVRMALGARRRHVLSDVLARTLGHTMAGVLIGALAAAALTGSLRAYLFDVSPTDPATFAFVAAILVVTALLAGWLPARRAVRIDPMAVLRSD